MKILCGISGIQFTCEHIPAALMNREAEHPIFSIKQSKLYGLYAKWTQGALTETDSYLLFLAFLKSTDRVVFRVPALRTANTVSIISNTLPKLVELTNRLTHVSRLHDEILAKIFITADTADLSQTHIWLDIWKENFRDYSENYRSLTISNNIRTREEVLQRLIKDTGKDTKSYAKLLAKWASEAGSFPSFAVKSELSGRKISCSEYWQEIIIAATTLEKVWLIPKADLAELIDHCTDKIIPGTIYQHKLFTVLKNANERAQSFLGFHDLDLTKSRYAILPDSATSEDAAISAMISSAPESEPLPHMYPTKLAFLRAKAKWNAFVSSKSAN